MLDIQKLTKSVKSHIKPLYLMVFLIFFLPRIIGLGSDISNYDASYWYPRMDHFTPALIKGDFMDTYQQYHPGVTVMLTSGTTKYAYEQLYNLVFHYNPRFIPHQFIKLQIATIFPLVLMISLLGTLIFYYLKNITNYKLALAFSILLSLEPFFLGVSKFLHLSALTSMFMFASFMTLYYYYFKDHKNKFLFYLSALLMGLGILTKVDAVIAAPVNAALIFASEYKKMPLKKIIKDFFLYSLIIALTFYILFPAMWVAPFTIIKRILVDGINDTAFDSGGAEIYTNIKALYYFETFFFRSLPTSTITFIAGLLLMFFNRKHFTKNENKLFYWILGYFLFNIIILTIPEKTKDRYLINLYPPMLFICAIAVYQLIKSNFRALKYSLIGAAAAFYIFVLYKYYPVYSFYYTELIGGPSGITKLGLSIKNRGEYYAQAAEYINKTDPNAAGTSAVIAHREQVRTFAPFYYGKLYASPGLLPDNVNGDYIISRPDLNYLIPLNKCVLAKTFGPKDPLGYQEVFVYKCKDFNNTYKSFRN